MTGPLDPTSRHVDAETRRDRVTLLNGYYVSARQELIERIAHRDRSIVLFLGTVAAVATVAFAKAPQGKGAVPAQGWLLLLIPLLGLGAALVYDWHNQVIGRLGAYLGSEFQVEVRFAFTGTREAPPDLAHDDALIHWDASREVTSLAKRARTRTYIPVGLIVTPQLAASTAGVATLSAITSKIAAGAGATMVTAITLLVLMQSSARRRESASKIRTSSSQTEAPH